MLILQDLHSFINTTYITSLLNIGISKINSIQQHFLSLRMASKHPKFQIFLPINIYCLQNNHGGNNNTGDTGVLKDDYLSKTTTFEWSQELSSHTGLTVLQCIISCDVFNIKFYAIHCTLKPPLFCKHNTSFCNSEDKTVIHLFNQCFKTQQLWHTVTEYIKKNLNIFLYYHQSVILGFLEVNGKVFLTLNHL